MNETINQTIQNVTQPLINAAPTIVQQRLLPWFPDWFVFLLGFLIVFIIYISLPDQLKNPTKKFIGRFGFFIIIGIFWLYFRGKWGIIADHPKTFPAPMNIADFYAVLIVLLYFLFLWGMDKLRYNSRQFIGDGVHGSFAGMPQRTKDGFLIFSIDGIETDEGIKWRRGKRLVVLREETGQFINECFVSIAHFRPINKERLPSSVIRFTEIKREFKRINEIYYGWFDAQHEKDWNIEQLEKAARLKSEKLHGLVKKYLDVGNPTMESFLEVLESQSAVTNNAEQNLDSVVINNEKRASHDKRMKKIYGEDKQKKVYLKSNEEE